MIQDCKNLINLYENIINETNNNNHDVGYILFIKTRLYNENERLKLIIETGI